MSTRSLINVECEDGKVRSVYVHFDGDEHLRTLRQYYNSQQQAEALVALGDMSVLDKYIDCPKDHSFDNRIDGYCVFYHRDRDEDWEDTKPREFKTLNSAKRQDRDQEFIYEWTKDITHWRKFDVYRKKYLTK